MSDYSRHKVADYAQSGEASAATEDGARDWRKAMSDHVAYALLVYTGLQIFVTVKAITTTGMSILPYLALVVLVAAIIPACRWFERRWTDLSDEVVADPATGSAFRRDVIVLWILAIGLPLVLTACFRALASVI